MKPLIVQPLPALAILAALLAAGGCATRRQLAAIQPGMTLAQVRQRFGPADETLVTPPSDGPREITWYYDAYRPRELFEWQVVPTQHPPGWRLEPGRTTVGVRYRRFEIIFHDGRVVGRAEFEPPTTW